MERAAEKERRAAGEARRHFVIRKTLHLLLGVLFLTGTWLLLERIGKDATLLALGSVLLVVLLGEFWRIEHPSERHRPVVKEKERSRLHGGTFVLLATIILVSLFEDKLALGAIAISIFGDAAASIAGRLVGRHTAGINRKKTYEGAIACWIVGLLAGLVFLPLPLSVALALAGAGIELACDHSEDNFLVPVAIGFLGFGLGAL